MLFDAGFNVGRIGKIYVYFPCSWESWVLESFAGFSEVLEESHRWLGSAAKAEGCADASRWVLLECSIIGLKEIKFI